MVKIIIQRCRHLFWKLLHYSLNMLHDSQYSTPHSLELMGSGTINRLIVPDPIFPPM